MPRLTENSEEKFIEIGIVFIAVERLTALAMIGAQLTATLKLLGSILIIHRGFMGGGGVSRAPFMSRGTSLSGGSIVVEIPTWNCTAVTGWQTRRF